MVTSKTQLDAIKRHQKKLDVIKIQPTKEEGERIRTHAKQAGKSLQGYVLDAVRKQMDEDDKE